MPPGIGYPPNVYGPGQIERMRRNQGNPLFERFMPHMQHSRGREAVTQSANANADRMQAKIRDAQAFLARLKGMEPPQGGPHQAPSRQPEPPPEPIVGKMGPEGLSSLEMPEDAKPVHQPGSRGMTNEYMIGTKDRPGYQEEVAARRRAMQNFRQRPRIDRRTGVPMDGGQQRRPSGRGAPQSPPPQQGSPGVPLGNLRAGMSPVQFAQTMGIGGLRHGNAALRRMQQAAPFRAAARSRQQAFQNALDAQGAALDQRKQLFDERSSTADRNFEREKFEAGERRDDQRGERKFKLERIKMSLDALATQADDVVRQINATPEGEEIPPALLDALENIRARRDTIMQGLTPEELRYIEQPTPAPKPAPQSEGRGFFENAFHDLSFGMYE